MCIQQLIEKKHSSLVHAVWIFLLVAFFRVPPREPSCFLASICLALRQLLSVSAGGLWDSEERTVCWNKEGGVQQGLCNHISFCLPPQLSLSTARKKVFPCSLLCPFCSACGGRNVGRCWGGLCLSLHAGSVYCAGTVYLLGDLY